jgi:hypothetical protein
MQRVIGDSVSVLDVPVRIAPEERWLVHNGWSALALVMWRVTLMATLSSCGIHWRFQVHSWARCGVQKEHQ